MRLRIYLFCFSLVLLFDVAQAQSYFTKSTPEGQGVSSASILEFVDKIEK
jgi:hypothetical protein